MKYEEKKILYLYDVVKHEKYCYEGMYLATYPQKRFAINLCAECADEIEKIIKEWYR